VTTALAALDAGGTPDPADLREAVRTLLRDLARRAPGRSVEVRVPPYGAVQCVTGPRHTRGNPPNVVEMDPLTWLSVATGRVTWADAIAAGKIATSGNRADISPYLAT
jgi:Bacterial SCP ortholog